jgi:hypothetical protein
MIKCIEQMEHCIEDLKKTMRDIKKEFDLTIMAEVIYLNNPARTVYTLFMDNLYDKIVAEDALSRELNGIKNYLLHRSSFITDIIQEKYDLKQENINLKEKYEELENKYKNMERNFYDAFS